MEFNPTKCQIINVTKTKSVIKPQYQLHGQVIESVSIAKFLGLNLSTGINFYAHVSRITSNVNRSLGFIKRNEISK